MADPTQLHRRRLRVFLSGRIDGVELDEASTWRAQACARLQPAGYDVYDPTRLMRAADGEYVARPNEVFHNDRWNLLRSDVVLVDLTMPETIRSRDAPFFTIGEMFLAHAAAVPIIAVGSPYVGRPGYEAIVTRSFDELDLAIDYILAVYRTDT